MCKQKKNEYVVIIEHMGSEFQYWYSIYVYESIMTSDILDVDNYIYSICTIYIYIYITGLRMREGAKTARLLLNFFC